MSREPELESLVAQHLAAAAIGQKIEIQFSGLPVPVRIEMRFRGGWVVEYTLVPGMPFELTRGEEGHLEVLNVTLMSYDRPR